jgi:hypothetical protein
MTVFAKSPPYRCRAWLEAVASLPCVRCNAEGRTQAAHRNEGKGMGMKTDDMLTAALCFECHTAIDSGPAMTRQERRSEMDRAIVDTLRQLVRAGMVGLT